MVSNASPRAGSPKHEPCIDVQKSDRHKQRSSACICERISGESAARRSTRGSEASSSVGTRNEARPHGSSSSNGSASSACRRPAPSRLGRGSSRFRAVGQGSDSSRVFGSALTEGEDWYAAVEDGDHVPRRIALPLAARHPAEEAGEAHVDRVEPAALTQRAGRAHGHSRRSDACRW